MSKDYSILLDKLRKKEIDMLEISVDEFMEFQKALLIFPQKKSILGEAKRGGGVVYKFIDGKSVQ